MSKSSVVFETAEWDSDVAKNKLGKRSVKEITKKEKKKVKKLIANQNFKAATSKKQNETSTITKNNVILDSSVTKNKKIKKLKNKDKTLFKNKNDNVNSSINQSKLKKSLNNTLNLKNKFNKMKISAKSTSSSPAQNKTNNEKKINKLKNKPKKKNKNSTPTNSGEILDTSTTTTTATTSPIKLSKHQMKLKKYLNQYNNNPKNVEKRTLRQRMISKLLSSRFRYLNEQMYSSKGYEALEYFKTDPKAFSAYHHGYQHQLKQWPLNPLDVFIQQLRKKPSNWTIADMGCGDAQLARSVSQSVHSFDLVALNDQITACDMARTPLGHASVDVVVFCLSLMGTNIGDFLLEANRILKIGGIMKVAEVASRFENIDDFIERLNKYGFKCTLKDSNSNYFIFFDFKKELEVRSLYNLPEITLNPCIYKKR